MNKVLAFACFLLILGCTTSRNDLHSTDIVQIKQEADAYYETDRFDEALILYNKLIALSDTLVLDNHYKRGRIRGIIGDYPGSIQDFKLCIDNNFVLENSYYNLGISYTANGQDSMALIQFLKVLDYNPEHEGALDFVSHLKVH